jgi:hypothetical protein
MRARIRLGNEADILAAVNLSMSSEARALYEALRPLGKTVLAFSQSVNNIPDEPDFKLILGSFDIRAGEEEPIVQDATSCWFPNPRMIELLDPPPEAGAMRHQFAKSLVDLALSTAKVRLDGLLFIDHLSDPLGTTLIRL